MDKIKKYKLWYKICLVVGIIGIFDIATQSTISMLYNSTDMGFVGIGVLYIFTLLFGVKVASFFTVLISMIVDSSVVWLLVAYILNKKIKIIESPTEENKKKLRQSKIITWVVMGIIVIFSLLAIISVFNS